MRRVRRSGGQQRQIQQAALLCFLTACPPVVSLQAQNASAILDRAVAAYANVQTLSADFVQLVRDPMLDDTATSRGQFLQQRPNRFAMRWTQPRGDVVVADGQYLWVYLPSSAPNQVIRSALTQGTAGTGADIVAEFLDRPQSRFTVAFERAEPVAGRPAEVLALTPRDRNAPYRRVLIWVDREDALVRRVEISEAAGSVRRITFDRLRTNIAIPAASFTFQPPRGARVVDASP
jgi:outer membrane lipoprotein carrier protein